MSFAQIFYLFRKDGNRENLGLERTSMNRFPCYSSDNSFFLFCRGRKSSFLKRLAERNRNISLFLAQISFLVLSGIFLVARTDKKEYLIFRIHQEIQKGGVAKLYMTNCLLILYMVK
jgi:hypothetical protein